MFETPRIDIATTVAELPKWFSKVETYELLPGRNRESFGGLVKSWGGKGPSVEIPTHGSMFSGA